jgi:hypothetical protein
MVGLYRSDGPLENSLLAERRFERLGLQFDYLLLMLQYHFGLHRLGCAV